MPNETRTGLLLILLLLLGQIQTDQANRSLEHRRLKTFSLRTKATSEMMNNKVSEALRALSRFIQTDSVCDMCKPMKTGHYCHEWHVESATLAGIEAS